MIIMHFVDAAASEPQSLSLRCTPLRYRLYSLHLEVIQPSILDSRVSLASTFPSELIVSVLSLLPTPVARQEAQLAFSLVSRHWYAATVRNTHFAVIHFKKATKLADKLLKEKRITHKYKSRGTPRVRCLYLRLPQLGGIRHEVAVEFSRLLDACTELDALDLCIGVGEEEVNEAMGGTVSFFVNNPIGLEAALARQTQLRVFKLAMRGGYLLTSPSLLEMLRPLKSLQVLDLTDTDVESLQPWESTEFPPIQLPLRKLIVRELEGPTSFLTIGTASILSFSGSTLRCLRLGMLWNATGDPFKSLLETITSFAAQLVEFGCRICRRSDLPFESKPFLDLNQLLPRMTRIETLEIELSAVMHEPGEDYPLTERDEVLEVDLKIIETFASMKTLRHLILQLEAEPPTKKLVEWARKTTVGEFTLVIGNHDPKPREQRRDVARWKCMNELARDIGVALPMSTSFHKCHSSEI
ncbi:hypothetical protein P7C70_g6720, partial [Phenoliferia sp. Uapishka_3]